MVDPNAKVSGSTAVRCWLVVFVNGSVKTRVNGTAACALAASASATLATVAIAPVLRSLRCMDLPEFRRDC
jgi:hypothetical protein